MTSAHISHVLNGTFPKSQKNWRRLALDEAQHILSHTGARVAGLSEQGTLTISTRGLLQQRDANSAMSQLRQIKGVREVVIRQAPRTL